MLMPPGHLSYEQQGVTTATVQELPLAAGCAKKKNSTKATFKSAATRWTPASPCSRSTLCLGCCLVSRMADAAGACMRVIPLYAVGQIARAAFATLGLPWGRCPWRSRGRCRYTSHKEPHWTEQRSTSSGPLSLAWPT